MIRPQLLLTALAATLAVGAGVRVLHHAAPVSPRASTHAVRAAAAPIDYQRASVDVPHGWHVLDQRANVTTWGDREHDDAVTVAAVAASTAPLAAVVADVAASSRRLRGVRDVTAPHELELAHGGARGDQALLLTMTLHDAGGRQLHVRQIWRRDARAAQDVVATWTSRDDDWPSSAEHGIPRADVR